MTPEHRVLCVRPLTVLFNFCLGKQKKNPSVRGNMGIHCSECSEQECGGDHVYAILLPDKAADGYLRELGSGFVYVGRTELRVEDRFSRNWEEDYIGYNSPSAKLFRNCGRDNLRLMHEIHSPFNPVRRKPKRKGAIASYAEYHLAKLLEEAGYLVESDARTAFKSGPKKSK